MQAASAADFVCSTTSCVGNQGYQGQISGYGGQYAVGESVMILVESGARLDIQGSRLWKQGGTGVVPWLNDHGYNAAVDIVQSMPSDSKIRSRANRSQLDGAVVTIRDTSIITNNGAMNVFARGQGTNVALTDCSLASTGFGAWAVVSVSGAAVNVQSVVVCSGGINSPAFVGGNLAVMYSSAHTSGSGSPVVYALGDVTLTHTTGSANNSAAVMVNGPHAVLLDHCDMYATSLAGVVLFSTALRTSAAFLHMAHGSMFVSARIPSFLVTNTVAYISLESVDMVPESRALVWAEMGSVTSDLTQFRFDNATLSGQAYVMSSRSYLRGFAVVGPGCLVSMDLQNETSWFGGTQYRSSSGAVDVSIDRGSVWYPYPPANVRALVLADSDVTRIGCTGNNVSYHSADVRNAYLASKAIQVPNCPATNQTWLLPRDVQGPMV
jgi:hypothetical protein